MLQPGNIIADRYEIVDTVGAGGMSVVYKALDHRLNRYVAIKVLKEEFSNDKTFVSKFRIEAQSAAGLSHPNIVNVYDVGDDNGIHYIVMELVEGITLKEYIQKKGHLPVSEAVNFSLQIASGIEVAHENHIIHRDIKPQNIIVAPSGILKVTDFGIAKAATSTTISSNAIGSVHYISPEQARGGFSDERSDIYSLGITMYEMVTGRVPFQGDNNVTVALMHIQDEMIPPSEYYPDILPSMEKVIAKCTQKKPERRYLTANALIADLRRVESDPSGNYVKMNTLLDDAPTRMMGDDEVGQIKERAKEVPVSEEPKLKKTPVTEQKEAADDGEEKMDPKLERLAKVLGVVAAVLVVMLILFGVGHVLGIFGSSSKPKEKSKVTTESKEDTTEKDDDSENEGDIEVPSVTNMSLEDAQKMLTDKNLKYEVEYRQDDSVEKNMVISQSPNSGDMVNDGDTVQLIVSLGASSAKVPDVVNLEDSDAVAKLEAEGFTVKRAYDYSDKVEKGKVMSQTPAANGSAAKGATVTITISQGEETKEVTMVNLKGMSLQNAKAKLSSLGLKYSVTKSYSDEYDEGEVMAQSYEKGAVLKSGTTVDITVSKGPDKSNVTYQGSTNIEDLLDDDVDSAVLKIVFSQGADSSVVYNGKVTHDSFPVPITVTGKSAGTGKLTVYVDGVKQSQTYSITINEVRE